jgi:hypothetical protein
MRADAPAEFGGNEPSPSAEAALAAIDAEANTGW